MMLMTIINSMMVKPRLAFLCRDRVAKIYQSLYLVPSRPMPCDLVKTSNTFCSPQESEVGSSCIERMPHSVELVMGSIGILRRNFSFLPCTSSPLTRVPRSGG